MSLNYWQNPHKPTMERLYVDSRVLHLWEGVDRETVKIWIEPSETILAGWVIKAKGDVSAIGRGFRFQQAVMDALRISQSQSWSDLMQLADSKTATQKPARRRADKLHPGQDRASETLNLDIPSIKMIGPVTIQLDHREPESLTALLASHPQVTVERVSLDLGDIQVEDREGNRLIIERKRCDSTTEKNDFEASVQVDGRLFDQSERLKLEAGASDRQAIPIFLLEGDVYGNSGSMLCQQIDGALSFLSAVQRISVLPTYNQTHTAYVTLKLASHFIDGLYSPVSLHKSKPKAVFDQQHYVLESLPGVSSKIAKALLVEFGSVRKVMSATETELRAVEGLGPRKVKALMSVLGEAI